MTVAAPDLLDRLADALGRLVPDGALDVVRRRSVADRLAGRPGRVTRLAVRSDETEFALDRPDPAAAPAPLVAHVVRGVTLSRRTPDLGEWLAALAEHVGRLAADRSGGDLAARHALAALGVDVPGPDVEVPADDVAGGLRSLPSRIAGLVPPDVADAVGRICTVLLETLGSNGSGPAAAAADLPRRVATDYLPSTLRAYLALPAAVRDRPLPDGRLPADALREQVGVVERAAAGIAADAGDPAVAALLANGLFLRDRLDGSGLDG
jgi:hypothetical protein